MGGVFLFFLVFVVGRGGRGAIVRGRGGGKAGGRPKGGEGALPGPGRQRGRGGAGGQHGGKRSYPSPCSQKVWRSLGGGLKRQTVPQTPACTFSHPVCRHRTHPRRREG